MTTLRDDLSRLAEEWERKGAREVAFRFHEQHAADDAERETFARCGEALRETLASHPESAPAPGEDGDLAELERLCKELEDPDSECLRYPRTDGLRTVAILSASVPALLARLRRADRNYLDLADAACRSSTSVEDACRQARETRSSLSKAREALRDLLDQCDEEVDGEQGEDTICIMCGGGDPCAPDCPAGRARAALRDLEPPPSPGTDHEDRQP